LVKADSRARPWTGNYTQCLLSQYNNAMYVFGADSSDVSVSVVVVILDHSFNRTTLVLAQLGVSALTSTRMPVFSLPRLVAPLTSAENLHLQLRRRLLVHPIHILRPVHARQFALLLCPRSRHQRRLHSLRRHALPARHELGHHHGERVGAHMAGG
jgi:hypothetical protein